VSPPEVAGAAGISASSDMPGTYSVHRYIVNRYSEFASV
jgi:hypothetical protein